MAYFRAINYWVLGGFSGEMSPYDAIRNTKLMSLNGLELTFPDCIKEDVTKDDCERILKFAKSQGVELRTLATGAYWGTSLSSEDKEEREKAIKFTKHYIEVASMLKVKFILVVPGAVDVAWDPSRPVTSYAAVWKNATASLKQVLSTAARHKVTLCLENVWNKFLLSPLEFKQFIDQFHSPYVGAYFDMGNVVINGYPEHWIEILGKRIRAVHLKNFKRSDIAGGIHGFGEDLLDGDVDFKKVLIALKKQNFSGPITAEMIPFSRLPDLRLPDLELAKRTAKAVRQILR